jgi:hypothetical protein
MRRRVAAAAAPVLLALVVLVQVWLVHARGLTPWCGGGFGMFSTIDGWGARHLHVWLRGDGWRREAVVPDELSSLKEQALALPDDTRLRALALALAARDDGRLGALRSVEILVLTRRFGEAELVPEGVSIASFETPLE